MRKLPCTTLFFEGSERVVRKSRRHGVKKDLECGGRIQPPFQFRLQLNVSNKCCWELSLKFRLIQGYPIMPRSATENEAAEASLPTNVRAHNWIGT
jgi:hypothetical protein